MPADDILIFIAWAIDVAQTGTAAAWMKATWYGYHSSDVPEFTVEQQVHQANIMLVQGLLYNPVLGLVKWSIIVFLMRLGDKRKIMYVGKSLLRLRSRQRDARRLTFSQKVDIADTFCC